jgi:hypothetical protein
MFEFPGFSGLFPQRSKRIGLRHVSPFEDARTA